MMIHESLISTVSQLQHEGIEQKQLSNDQLQLVYQQNWFNLWVPEALGGMGATFVDGLKLLEELAYWDGGLGWTVTLCSGANMFVGFLEAESARSIWKDPKVCFGGSGRVDGRAERMNGGYEITGFWRYATGAPHLTHFTLNAWLYQDGVPLVDADNNPRFLSFFVPKERVQIHEDWNTFGLECTASHSFSVDEVFVPQEHSFQLIPEAVKIDSRLYTIPFTTFAELTLLVNYIGMYRRFVDLLKSNCLAKYQNQEAPTDRDKHYLALLEQHQIESGKALDWVWSVGGQISDTDRDSSDRSTEDLQNEISSKARDLVTLMRSNMADLMPTGGIKAAQYDEELNVVFRNLFTASQHALLNN